MDKQVQALVEETKALINEVENGDTERAAWLAIQDRVQKLCQNKTQPEVGRLIGRSQSWVGKVVNWDTSRANNPPWGSGSNKRTEVTTKVMSDPKGREEVLNNLPDEHLATVARQALKKADLRYKQKHTKPKDPSVAGDLMDGFATIYHASQRMLKVVQENPIQADGLPEDSKQGIIERSRRAINTLEMLIAQFEGEDMMDEITTFLNEEGLK